MGCEPTNSIAWVCSDSKRSAMSESRSNPVSKGRFPEFPELDGFRGLAIFLVLAGHTFEFSLGYREPWRMWGSVGVVLFFALSGFLITGLLCAERSRTGGIDLRGFWMRRVFRIVPAMAVFLLGVAILKGRGWVVDSRWRDFGLSLAFVRNLAGRGPTLEHLWSIAVEMQFYAVWPILFFRLSLRGAQRVGMGIFLAVILWRAGAIGAGLYSHDSATIYLRTDFRIDALMGGSLLAMARQTGRLAGFSGWLRVFPPVWVFPALLGWSGWMSAFPGVHPLFITVEVLLALLLLARLLAFPTDGFGQLCRSGWMRWLGRRSYSIYLWQQLFILTKTPDWGWIREFPVDVFMAFAAGLVSYHRVEVPFLRLRTRWGGRPVASPIQNGSGSSSAPSPSFPGGSEKPE